MLHFKHSSLIDAPVEVVWSFHESSDILQLLTPPWQPVQIIRREGGLDVGAITECEKNRLFTDRQIEGPMESWTHRHHFIEENGKTRLTDAIDFELPGGMPAELVLGWWVDLRLKDMFSYRHQVTKRECEK